MTQGKVTICVFCGSSVGRNPAHRKEAQRLGTLIGTHGHRMAFGGGDIGLMGETARAARDAGAKVIGIIPQFLRHLEPPSRSAEELIVTADLQERKLRMTAISDVFVLLPGGLGTLDEFFEVVTMTQLEVHKKPVILINSDNFFAPLVVLIDAVIAAGFAREEVRALFQVVPDADAAMDVIEKN